MAVNHADFTMLGTVVVTPMVAGGAAYHAGAAWLTPFFVIAGIGAGIGLGFVVSRFAYWILDTAGAMRPIVGWISLLVYMVAPPLISAIGIIGVGYASAVIARWIVH